MINQGEAKPRVLLSGIDSLYVSYFFDGLDAQIDWDELHFQKEKLKSSRTKEFADVTLGSETFALMPYGRNKYTYVLQDRSFTVHLGELINPCCHVQFSSEGLWSQSPDALLKRLVVWRDSVNYRETRRPTVSRLDISVDFHLPDIDFKLDDFLSRAKKDNLHRGNREDETFSFGSDAVKVRVYNKSKEIREASNKTWLYDLWGIKEDVWRVEFQVRREFLKSFGLKTVDDLARMKWDLVHELATSHTSLRRPTEDSNRSRWPLHPLWQSLIEHIESAPRTGLVESFDPKAALLYRQHQQLKSIYGDLKGLGALLALRGSPHQPVGLDDLIESLPNLLDEIHDPHIWASDLQSRIDRFDKGLW